MYGSKNEMIRLVVTQLGGAISFLTSTRKRKTIQDQVSPLNILCFNNLC